MRKIWEKRDNISCDLLCKISHCIVHAVFSEEAETYYINIYHQQKGLKQPIIYSCFIDFGVSPLQPLLYLWCPHCS